MQPHIRAFVEKAVVFSTCPDCEGTRLAPEARSSKIDGRSIADVCAMQISDLAEWVRGLDLPQVAPLLKNLCHLLDSFADIGLGYLSLDRPTGTLSGGESQRIKMIRHLGSSLTDITYVFDEPTIGMHPHDIARMNNLLLQLRDKGNTVLVVEHKPEAIAIADHIVDLGPRAGTEGGQVVFEGTVDELRRADTLTGRHLDDRASLKPTVRTPSGALKVRGADTHNLQNVDVDIPLGVLVVVTGVAGSGKSSLIHGSVADGDGVVTIDQSPIKGSRRSNPATYTGLLEPIRKAFAKANGVKPALFSSNSEGACPTCNGAGVVYTDLGVMATVESVCEDCEGKRFQTAVLDYTLAGKNIAEVLAMSVAQAQEYFADGEARTPAASKILQRLSDVGLGYLRLGQPLTTLSGGERQRLKLATAMAEKGETYILDEPTRACTSPTSNSCSVCSTGSSSPASRDRHRTPPGVMAHADWIIDLGPGAATTVDASSSRAPPANSWRSGRRSPASISPSTSGSGSAAEVRTLHQPRHGHTRDEPPERRADVPDGDVRGGDHERDERTHGVLAREPGHEAPCNALSIARPPRVATNEAGAAIIHRTNSGANSPKTIASVPHVIAAVY